MIDTEKYLQENKGLVESLVNRFYIPTSKFSRDDLVQEANCSAIYAINKFDETKNKSKLSTYIYSAVWRSCRDFVRRNKNDLYKTGYHQTQDWKEEQRDDTTIDGPIPTGSFGSTVGPMAVRSDVISSETGETFASTIPSGSPPQLEALIAKEQICILREEINSLPPRERDIIKSRFFEEKKMAEIAREQGVTRQRISLIVKRAFNRLQDNVLERLGHEVLL